MFCGAHNKFMHLGLAIEQYSNNTHNKNSWQFKANDNRLRVLHIVAPDFYPECTKKNNLSTGFPTKTTRDDKNTQFFEIQTFFFPSFFSFSSLFAFMLLIRKN